ncbi:MAG: hypothetical protein ACYSUT_12005 [Planctomycetota bacterium]|jgi:hypothetical protein
MIFEKSSKQARFNDQSMLDNPAGNGILAKVFLGENVEGKTEIGNP